MSFNHEAVAALPVASAADKALIRALCTRRFAYTLTAAESATNFVAADPDTGVVPLYLIQNSTLFAYDSTDSTTAHDGATCLVSSDGKRFKSGTISVPYSVLDKDTTAQPASPSVGDRYIVPTAATGTDWSGKDGQIAIYTAAGWRFATVPIGRLIYVEDETAYYHRNASGNWTAGVGSIPLAASSVKITNVLGANASYVIKVENQTTNSPPASPIAPVAYIIGSSPTGAWSGNAGKLAVCLTNGSFTIITPAAGDVVYDKAQQTAYQYNGTAWVSANAAVLRYKRSYVAADTALSADFGSSYYTYSSSTGFTTSNFGKTCSNTITYAALSTSNLLRFKIRAVASIFSFIAGSSSDKPITIGLFVDALTTAQDWVPLFNATGAGPLVQAEFYYQPANTDPHTYTIRFTRGQATGYSDFAITTLGRNMFSVEELVLS